MAFIAEELALDFIRSLRPLIAKIGQHDRDLKEQISDAANSASLNLMEGRRREGRDRTQQWRIAGGSAAEAMNGLRVAEAWGYVSQDDIALALSRGDALCAVTWRLVHPVPRAAQAPGR